MHFLTQDMFRSKVKSFSEQYPDVEHWNMNRWVYHSLAVEILKERSNRDAKFLEVGPAGIKLVQESDVMDFRVPGADWPVSEVKYYHDAKRIPWPIADKTYDFFVALRVFQHLAPVQKEAFAEAKRIAKNVLIVVPDAYITNSIGSKAISLQDFVEYNDNQLPTIYKPTPHGNLYFWENC